MCGANKTEFTCVGLVWLAFRVRFRPLEVICDAVIRRVRLGVYVFSSSGTTKERLRPPFFGEGAVTWWA